MVLDLGAIRRRFGALKKTNPKSLEVPPGHVPIYVGEDRNKYVIPLKYLSSPILKQLLELEEEELGSTFQGPIILSCDGSFFEEKLKDIKEDAKKQDIRFQDLYPPELQCGRRIK